MKSGKAYLEIGGVECQGGKLGVWVVCKNFLLGFWR